MPDNKNNPAIKEHLSKIRQGISSHKTLSGESKRKALEKLDVVQKHVDEGKVTETTVQHLRDIIHHLEENPTLIDLVNEALPYLPH